MSGILEHAMRLGEYGLNSVPDKRVCSAHFKEKPIKAFIKNADTAGKCDYCGRNTNVCDLEDVMIQIMKTVMFFYTDPANFMPYETAAGGYHDQENIYSSYEVIFEHFELDIADRKLFVDIENSLDFSAAWSDENKYTNDPAESLNYEWGEFKNIVKHKARYLFFEVINERMARAEYYMDENPMDILKAVGKKIIDYNLVQKLPTGTIFYRCRQHALEERTTSADQMCAPEVKFTRNPNRMSPSGISMFYGAFDLKTAKLETLDLDDLSKPVYTYVNFTTTEELTIVDFSKLPDNIDIWDADNLSNFYPLKFLHNFIKDLSKPVARDGLEHIEYVPTQIITEYLRYSFGHIHAPGTKIDGIVFPSSRTMKSNSCVLFMDHEESLTRLEFDLATLKTIKIKKQPEEIH